jgi:TPR repeat protein
MLLLAGKEVKPNLTKATRYFKMPAENGNPEGQTLVGSMVQNGIGTFMNSRAAVRYYDLSSDQSPDGAAL